MVRAAFFMGIFVALSLRAPPAAYAADGSVRALAQSLFEEGRDLLDADRVLEACAKLRESQRLDAAGGTLLLLGICHSREGRTATAWADLKGALAMARRARRQDRIQLAEQALRELESRVPYLRVKVSPAARVPRLSIRVDGVELGPAAWDTPFPIDPGEHAVSVEAPGKQPLSWRVQILAGEARILDVPALSPLPRSASRSVPERARTPERLAAVDRGVSVRAVLPFVTGGVALVGGAAGAYFGLRAFAKENEKPVACAENDAQCRSRFTRLDEGKRQSAKLSNLAFGVALTNAVVTAYLVWNSPPAQPEARARGSARRGFRLEPRLVARGFDLSCTGDF